MFASIYLSFRSFHYAAATIKNNVAAFENFSARLGAAAVHLMASQPAGQPNRSVVLQHLQWPIRRVFNLSSSRLRLLLLLGGGPRILNSAFVRVSLGLSSIGNTRPADIGHYMNERASTPFRAGITSSPVSFSNKKQVVRQLHISLSQLGLFSFRAQLNRQQ